MIEVITTCEKCGKTKKSPPAHVGDSHYWLSCPSRPKGWKYYYVDFRDSNDIAVNGKSVLVCPECDEKFLQTFEHWTPTPPNKERGN